LEKTPPLRHGDKVPDETVVVVGGVVNVTKGKVSIKEKNQSI
jgi:hypothetical protein